MVVDESVTVAGITAPIEVWAVRPEKRAVGADRQ